MDNSRSPKIKIITVEDSPLVVERMQTMLAEATYVEFMGNAENISSALNLINIHQPDVAILDICLEKEKGKANGINLLIELRQSYRDLIIIMFTNLVESQYRNACLALGADYFFDKSNDFEKIPEVLKEVFQVKRNKQLE